MAAKALNKAEDVRRETAEVCLAAIEKRQTLSASEERLLESIKNDIRLQFGLPGAVQLIVVDDGSPPIEWFW